MGMVNSMGREGLVEKKITNKIKRVITYGTFDLFHEGHYRLLQRAKALGDYLIVGITTETYDRARGKLGVVDSLMTRMENVRKTGFADEIIVEETQGQNLLFPLNLPFPHKARSMPFPFIISSALLLNILSKKY